MKNHSFKKMITLSLLASMCLCNAEEDGVFFVIDYQTSLVRQELKNPGYIQAQNLKQSLKDGALRLQTAAVPLAFYLDMLANKAKTLVAGANGTMQAGQSQSAQIETNPALKQLATSIGILGGLLDLSQQYANQNIVKPLAIDVGGQEVNITDGMLSAAQSVVFALGQVGLKQSTNSYLYQNLMETMLLGTNGTNGEYNGVSVGDIATGMQKFTSQASLIGADSTISQLNALVNNGVSLAKDTLGLGDFVEQNICNNNVSSCLTNPSYQQGLERSKALVRYNLAQFENASKSLYNISYIPNLASTKDYRSASMNGFGVKIGYKQFFTEKKNIGLRYYGFVDYGYASFGDTSLKVGTNLVTYGVGTDFLYNFFERSRRREKTSIGLFVGAQIAGQTWDSNVVHLLDGAKPKINSTSFQFLFDLGVRTNFAKKKIRKKRVDQGLEFGVKIPVIAHQYFKAQGSSASYMRNFSFYVGYAVGF
ncbi:outer membrane protein [Helicobacter acinonychis]|uniref:outer membrane protein n=1 Tax=Helicobacter acinonychis TaxID=212 RepID=UPI000CF07F64|nr:outer membrane protein [Helicobacter acinonychis]